MKLFIQKTLVVVLAVIITSLFVKGIIQVGDTIITNESSKNYNGYYTLRDEQEFVDNGLTYQLLDSQIGYVNDIMDSGYMNIEFDIPYIIYSYNEYGNVLAIQILIDYDNGYTYIRKIDGVDLVIEYIEQICIVGISNYEVTP